MKKIFLILSLFVSSFSFGQNTHIVPGNNLNAKIRLDSVGGGLTHVKGSGIEFNFGDTIVLFSDSYGNAVGASSTAQGFGQLLAYRLGAVLNSISANGSCIEKRTPTNPFTGVNAIDRLSNIPLASSHNKYIIISLGLNDIGENSANYTTANFKTDYDSVLNYIIGNRGYTAEQILVCSPPWIGATGQASYAVLSGNAAPTTARHISFIQATQDEAVKWATGYFAPYWFQLHDTTHMATDGIHPNDAGHSLLADYLNVVTSQRVIFPNAFASAPAASVINAVIPNQSLILGDHSVGSTSTPNYIDLGKKFYSSTGGQAQLKLYLYSDGTTTNNTGFAVTPGFLEIHSFNTGGIDEYVGGVKQSDQQANTMTYYYNGTTSSTSTATPTAIDMGGSFNSSPGSNALKWMGYHSTTNYAGIGEAANVQYYSIYTGGSHDFYVAGTKYASISSSAMTLTSIKAALAASTTSAASLNIPEGVDPTSPSTGDLWTNSTSHDISYRTNSVTYTVPKVLTTTATLDFPSTGSAAVADLTVTVTGAAVGDEVNLGIANASVTATASFIAWVSSANTVTVRFSPKATEDPASGTFRVTVVKY